VIPEPPTRRFNGMSNQRFADAWEEGFFERRSGRNLKLSAPGYTLDSRVRVKLEFNKKTLKEGSGVI
jgi:hypothetical protein